MLDSDTAQHADALQLTDAERRVLAEFAYQESLHGPRTVYEVVGTGRYDLDPRLGEAYYSLCRFGYIVRAEPRTVRSTAAVDTLSEAGRNRLAAIGARRYRCCDFAVTMPCVCSERTFCPNHGGGCHGTHD